MLLNQFLNHAWLAVGAWAVIYCSDYFLTHAAARLYQAGVTKHFVFAGGYELNPHYQEEVALLRRFSFRFFLDLVAYSAFLLIIHAPEIPELFAFVWGMYVGAQFPAHIRHFRNLVLFRHALRSEGMAGRIEYQHWLSLRLSSIDILSFAVFYVVLFLICDSYAFLGGAAGCLLLGLQQFRSSRKREQAQAQAEVTQPDGTN
jgi:hypothetical protein